MYNKIVLGSLILLLGHIVHSEGIDFQNLSLKEGLEKARVEKKLLFIDIYATWCGPCKYLSEEVFVNEELGEYINDNFISIKLNGEKGDGMSLMQDFSLNAYPTMLMLTPDKQLNKKIVGAANWMSIRQGAYEAVNPKTTLIYKYEKKYNNGDRSKGLMKSYLTELISEGRDHEKVMQEYYSLYPNLDLKYRTDFQIFAELIQDSEHPLMKNFLENSSQWAELHGSLAEQKMGDLLIRITGIAAFDKDSSQVYNGVNLLFKPYTQIFKEAYSKEELSKILMRYFHEMVDAPPFQNGN